MTNLTQTDIERLRRKQQREQEKADAEALRQKGVSVLKKRLKGQKRSAYQKRVMSVNLLAKI